MKHTVKRIWNGITTLLVSLLAALVLLVWGARWAGFEIFIVQSGSMEPAYPVGALVYVKPADVNELRAGDVITFEMGGGVRGTHRIHDVLMEDGALSFVTKGDSNELPDANPVKAQDIVGKVRFSVPKLGFLISCIQQPAGRFAAICGAALLVVLTIMPDVLFPEEKKSKKRGQAK